MRTTGGAAVAAVGALLASLAACGGGSDSPTGPAPPTPRPGATVNVVVYYDEDGDGRLEGGERGRVPGVSVDIDGSRASTATLTGLAAVGGVADGPHTAVIDASTLPPFYQAGPGVSLTVPPMLDVALAATLRIGGNRPNTYMAFGDSITQGDGSSDGNGYVTPLQQKLRAHFGRGNVINRGGSGTRSTEGVERIARNLGLTSPAYTLILYGTNDWVQCKGAIPCVTIDSLRTIIGVVHDVRSLPVLGTIIPVNPDSNPQARADWVRDMNVLIRGLASDEGAALADLEAAFLRQSDLRSLFSDHVHPNDAGYEVMAEEFFRAISGGEGP
jgi:lysophospholipase L1-like esterase